MPEIDYSANVQYRNMLARSLRLMAATTDNHEWDWLLQAQATYVWLPDCLHPSPPIKWTSRNFLY